MNIKQLKPSMLLKYIIKKFCQKMETIAEINTFLNTLQEKLNNAPAIELNALTTNLKSIHRKLGCILDETTDKLDELNFTIGSEDLKPLNELYLKMNLINRKSNDCLVFLPYDQAKEFNIRTGIYKDSWNKYYRTAYNKKNVIELIYYKWCQFNVYIGPPYDEVYTIYTLCWLLNYEQKGETTIAQYHKDIKEKFNFEYTNRVQ